MGEVAGETLCMVLAFQVQHNCILLENGILFLFKNIKNKVPICQETIKRNFSSSCNDPNYGRKDKVFGAYSLYILPVLTHRSHSPLSMFTGVLHYLAHSMLFNKMELATNMSSQRRICCLLKNVCLSNQSHFVVPPK